jgi:hypothetical protein
VICKQSNKCRCQKTQPAINVPSLPIFATTPVEFNHRLFLMKRASSLIEKAELAKAPMIAGIIIS